MKIIKVISKLGIHATRAARARYDSITYRTMAFDQNLLTKLRSIFHGRTALIVGNGPSLNKTPLEYFSDLPSIGVNKINLLFHKTTWRPHVIVCINALVSKQNADYYLSSEIPILASWKCRWFLGVKGKNNIHYLLQKPTIDFSRDAFEGFGGNGGTVIYAALQIAYALCVKRVILFGIDHTFSGGAGNCVYERRRGEDVDHFDSEYFKEGTYWGLPNLDLSEKAYRMAKEAFDAAGIEIFDATVDGRLTVFPKICMKEARRICGVSY